MLVIKRRIFFRVLACTIKPIQLKSILFILLCSFLSACLSSNKQGVESEYSTASRWQPYDGMTPSAPNPHDYFATPFMAVTTIASEASFKIADKNSSTTIYYSEDDAAVVAIAATALSDDIKRITGVQPLVSTAAITDNTAIIVGTIGQSPLIDTLIANRKLNTSAINGKWEAYTAAVINTPLPGVEQALVIAGSDRRGTAYGVFALSEAMGVSPWYFWGDVATAKKPALYVSGSYTQHSPAVKYRGIFINDEDWGFQPWAAKTFEPEFGNIGPKTYATVFELMLRLHANTIWPAMHEYPRESTPFYLHPQNKVVADNYAVIISTSHHEPMMRNSHEYKPEKLGDYSYWSNRDNIYTFWEQRVIETASYENIYTIGMRGRADAGMFAPKGITDEEKAAKIQNDIIPDQRKMIAEHVHANPADIPQIFIPYKETLVQYQSGLQLPEDITIVWPDDNHGYIRQLSTPEENQRSGGSGVYYHASYWGLPSSYLWLYTTPPGMTLSEMIKAWDFSASKYWLINIGDIKPHEIGTDFFLRLARNPEAFRNFDQQQYLSQWAAKHFTSINKIQANTVADILGELFHLNINRRPEHLNREKSGFSLTSKGDEAQKRLDDFAALAHKASAIYASLSDADKAAFYAMVLYPVRASNYANQRVLLAERSRLWASQNRTATNELAKAANNAQQALLKETRYYNEQNADGKWNHMLSPMPTEQLQSWARETQNAWIMPKTGSFTPSAEAALGVVPEGAAVPLVSGQPGTLPTFNRPADSRYFIDVFNQGQKPLPWTASANRPWVNISQMAGSSDTRLIVSVDWRVAPKGTAVPASIVFNATGYQRTIDLTVFNPEGLTPASLPKAVENNGRVSIEAEDFLRLEDKGNTGWRKADSATASRHGMTIQPVTSQSIAPDKLLQQSPSLTYQFHMFNTGGVEIATQCLPTHRLTSAHRGLRYAISLNGDTPQVIDINAIEYSKTWKLNTLRAASIGTSTHTVAEPGLQTLKIWMVDAGVVLDNFNIVLK